MSSLPRDLFENKTGENQIVDESQVFYLVEKVDFDNGIQSYLKGAEYPQKGMAEPQTLFFLNISKRLMSEGAKIASKLPVLAGLFVTYIIPHKGKKNGLVAILEVYNSILWKIISPYILKNEYMTAFARESRALIYEFLIELQVSENQAYKTSSIISHFFEYDNAYRYRLQDMFHSTSEQEFKDNPRKELKKFTELTKERDEDCISIKTISAINLLRWVLLIPKFKKALAKALTKIDFSKLQFDEVDIYWVSMRNDYKYFGEATEKRAERNQGKKLPIPMPKEEYEAYLNTMQKESNEDMVMRSIDILLKNKEYRKIIKDKLKL